MVQPLWTILAETCDLAVLLADIDPRTMKTLSAKDLHVNVCGSIVHNSPKVETTPMSISW